MLMVSVSLVHVVILLKVVGHNAKQK